MAINLFLGIVIFIIGTALGSFTSVCVYRLHTKEHKVLKGRSFCPSCKVPLKPRDLIPLVSYIALRGRCRNCQADISYMYPLLELLNGGLLLALFVKYPFFNEFLQFDFDLLLQFLLFTFYTFILLFTFFFDLHYLHVADEVLLPGILVGLLTTFLPFTPNLIDMLIGILIGGGFFALQYALSKGKWVGSGDIRVGALIGVMFGWQLTLFALICSYIVGSIVAVTVGLKKGKFIGVKIPFAPFLVTGSFVTMFFGREILEWYLKFIGL